MELNKILDSIYLLPALLEHFDKPTDTTTALLRQNGIGKVDADRLRRMRHLIEYHHETAVTWKPNYKLLRQGLKEYYDDSLFTVFRDLGLTSKNCTLLDYGCGEGYMAAEFRLYNPAAVVMMIDREAKNEEITKIDFEENPEWYKPYIDSFHYILLSEVLHCKSRLVQNYLIDSSIEMLREGGSLIIIENVDYCMEYRISKLKGTLHKVLDYDSVMKLIGNKLDLIQTKTLNRHTAYEFRKV